MCVCVTLFQPIHIFFCGLDESSDTTDLLGSTTQYQRLSGKMCSHVSTCINTLNYYNWLMHCSCVGQHKAFMADLKYKLKNIEEELQTACKCESNAWCNQYVLL